MIGWKGKGEGNVNDGVVNGTGVSVWSVEKSGVISPSHRQNGDGVEKCGAVCPHRRRQNGGGVGKNGGIYPRRIGVGKSDWVYLPQRTENDVDDVSSRYFSASPRLFHPLYASSDDFSLSHGPNPDPSHEKTHPSSTVSPSRPLQLLRPSVSAPTSRPPLSPLELPERLGL